MGISKVLGDSSPVNFCRFLPFLRKHSDIKYETPHIQRTLTFLKQDLELKLRNCYN